MEGSDRNSMEELIRQLTSADPISTADIPKIDLYMDQVLTFMDENLSAYKRHESDKLLTKTMINNYTKDDLLPSPVKKKYSKDHMVLLILIYYLKSILSIGDIQTILSPLEEKYFGKSDDGISISGIYEKAIALGQEQNAALVEDIMKQYDESRSLFEDEDDPKKRKFLNDFAFICSLCYEVYVKKSIIEKLIDNDILK